MTPVHQTVFGDEVGNCLQAAIASLFDLPLDAVPHFIASGDGWWAALQAWLHQRGLHCVFTPAYVDQPGYYLMVGKSPRGAYHHVVVAKDGECIHDPHPDGTGLLERSGEYIMAWVFEEAG